MSETATPTAAPASNSDFVGFADALDAGINSLDAPQTETPVAQPVQENVKTTEVAKVAETTKQPETVKQATETKVKNPFDIVADRILNKEEVQTKEVDDLDIKQPENLKPEAQTAWARLTKDLRDARAKIKELEVKTAEAPQNSIEQLDLKAQLDALRSERDEYAGELKLARLESTREYKQAVTEPLGVIQKEIADISALYQTDPRAIYSAMVEPDMAKRRAMLKEATANFDPVDSLAIRNKAEELQKVFERRDLLTKDVQTVLEMMENDEKQEIESYQKRMQEEVTAAYKLEWENMQKENPLLRPIQDNEAWNNTLKSIEQQAFEIENTELEPRQKARLTFNAAALPVVMGVFKDYVENAQKRISELETLSKELRAATPSAGTDGTRSSEIPSDLSFLDALERGLNKS